MSSPKSPKKPIPQDALQPFADALREQVPSKEALLSEGKAFTLRRRKNRNVVGAGLLSVALASGIWINDPAWQTEDVVVAMGQRQQIQLSDGSQVELDSGTHLRIEKRLRSRQLELVKGQAQFTVMHDDSPFIVRSQGVRIRDIGTVFDVRSDPRGVDVGVIEGIVEVQNAQSRVIRLQANQQVRASLDLMGSVQPFDTARSTAWRHGKLRFDGTPLREVVADLARYRQMPVRLGDARAGDLRLSGEFDSGSIEVLINLLPSILPVNLQRLPDGTVTLTRKAR